MRRRGGPPRRAAPGDRRIPGLDGPGPWWSRCSSHGVSEPLGCGAGRSRQAGAR
jgi:hypothetical protein